jgi:hypothetical protein
MPVTIADITLGHPRNRLVKQLYGLLTSKAITEPEYHALTFFIGKEQGALDTPGTLALTYPLERGRSVRVHKYSEGDQAHEMGQTLVEKAALTPTQVIAHRVSTLRKANPTLSETEAQAQVLQGDRDLYEAYVAAARKGEANPRPVAKAQPLTPEAVHQEAEALMAKEPGLTKRDALARLAQQHPDEREYSRCYRAYHLGEGLAEGDTLGETEAPAPVAKAEPVWSALWNLGRG